MESPPLAAIISKAYLLFIHFNNEANRDFCKCMIWNIYLDVKNYESNEFFQGVGLTQ